MILFKSDWDKYPDAIIDRKTTNRSFYVQALKYKLMGIDNNAFLLSLLDPSLQGVDPFSEELTRDQKDRIIIEINRNPWYFMREIVRVSLGGGGTGLLKANRGNIALFFCYLCHAIVVLIQIRQTGKSLNTDALKSYILFFATLKTTVTFLVNTNKNRTESLDRIRAFESMLPSYLRVLGPNDINNMNRIHIKATDNKYETAVAQQSVDMAKVVHRGGTSSNRFIDESAYVTNLEESLTSMLKTGTEADEQAEAAGSLYGTLVSTTAGYKDSRHGRYMYDYYAEGAVFTEDLYDCEDLDAFKEMVRRLSPKNLYKVTIEMNHRQLGRTDAWLLSKIEDTSSTGNDTLTDYYNVWVTDKGAELLSPDEKKKISESKNLKYKPEISSIEGYTLRWHISDEERQKIISSGESIVAGLDTSEALGNDAISLTLTRVTTGEVIAAGDFNETNTTIFGTYLAELLVKYPKMMMTIEKRSTGISMVDTIVPILLERGINPLLRLFNWVINDMGFDPKKKVMYEELMKAFDRKDRRVFDRYKKYFGFSTSGSGRTSRTKLYSETFNAAVKYTGSSMRDHVLVRQVLGLRDVNGRVDHDPKDHDDMVIAWLLAFWTLKNGNNLNHYGISLNSVLIHIKENIYKDGKVDIAKMTKMKAHNKAMEAIKKLSDIISVSKNMVEVSQGKMLLRKISKHLDYSVTPHFNVDVYLAGLSRDKQMEKRAA